MKDHRSENVGFSRFFREIHNIHPLRQYKSSKNNIGNKFVNLCFNLGIFGHLHLQIGDTRKNISGNAG